VAWPCGVTFGRWVTPWDAELDLLREAGLNWPPGLNPPRAPRGLDARENVSQAAATAYAST